MTLPLRIAPEVIEALEAGGPVVALETTAIAHGLPYPANLELAQRQQRAIRARGAVPAVIGLWQGEVHIGLDDGLLEAFARGQEFAKVSRRDIAAVLAKREPGATTVAGTMICAAAAGIRLFATGGIGGV
ncbi:MAG TPA: pseudouridine-5'-phosphate glycosidase, partial [Kiloniellales bacterium]|nr:pseudouridine-5'-phosphate glycosidase [Kiloniellales bacterium]